MTAPTTSAIEAEPTRNSEAGIAAERLHRQRQVALGYRLFAVFKWGDMGDGHITARDPEFPDCMWMLSYPTDFGRATVKDLILIGPDGKAVDSADKRHFNRPGYRIHHPIHMARLDIISAAHVHTNWGTPFSAEMRMLEPISQESCIFYDDHVLVDDQEVQVMSVECGHRIAAALGDNKAAILRNHGLLATGETVASCIANFITMERAAEVHMKARDAKPIDDTHAQQTKDANDRLVNLEASFDFLVRRHLGEEVNVD